MITSKHTFFNGWVMYERGREGFLALHPFGYVAWQDDVEIFIRDSLGTTLTFTRNLTILDLDDFVSRNAMSGEPAGDEWRQFIDDLFENWKDYVNEYNQSRDILYVSPRDLMSPITDCLVEVAKSKQHEFVEAEHAVFS